MDFEQQLGIKLSVLISGLVGGIVSLTYEERISIQRATLLIAGGAATAAYLQPMAEHYIGIPDKFSAGLGFVLGLVSMKIIDFVIQNSEKFLNAKFLIRQNADGKSILRGKFNSDTERNNERSRDTRNNTPTTTRASRKKTSTVSKED